VNNFEGERRPPEFLARTVAGQTPVLRLDGG
jgi:glutathione S-transferase